MSNGLVLGVLTVLGLFIGSASTLWSMTRNTTFQDAEGNKRLTPAGHIAVALALGSFVTAVASFGLKTLSDQQAAEARRAEETRREEAEKAEAFRQEERERRAEEDRRLDKAERGQARAEARATLAEQRLLIATTAREQRERDQNLARDVNRGSSENLARARQALVEIGRTLQPIRSVSVYVTFKIDRQNESFQPLENSLQDVIGDVVRRYPDDTQGFEAPVIRQDGDRRIPVQLIVPESVWQGSEFGRLFGFYNIRILIFRRSPDFSAVSPMAQPGTEDLELSIWDQDRVDLIVKPADDDNWSALDPLLTAYGFSETPSTWSSNGTIIAVPDLAGTVVIIGLGGLPAELPAADVYRARTAMTLDQITLNVNGNSLSLQGNQLRRHVNQEGETFWSYKFPSPDPLVDPAGRIESELD